MNFFLPDSFGVPSSFTDDVFLETRRIDRMVERERDDGLLGGRIDRILIELGGAERRREIGAAEFQRILVDFHMLGEGDFRIEADVEILADGPIVLRLERELRDRSSTSTCRPFPA